ncbi:MAG: DUF4911 domain-containing protein [Synergistetes bacterium]|nr:DUF4911 domain-containing protein [Synergistota bacterium]MDW8192921.1 DUF4911 domain-containing protein [Synergistota bacterium]
MSRPRIDISKEPDKRVIKTFFKLSPENIYYLCSIFQCYDEIGEIRTVDPKEGIIVLISTPSCLPICMKVIEGLREEGLNIEEIKDEKMLGMWSSSSER